MRQVISTLGEGKMYYTAKLHPNTDQQNMLFAGCADKKVYQWDANSGDLVQVRDLPLLQRCILRCPGQRNSTHPNQTQ